jgi:hypothetical protein
MPVTDSIVGVRVNVANFRELAEKVARLPEPFRPQFFSLGGRVRDKDASRVDDAYRFGDFLDDRVSRVSGFTLLGSRIQFSFLVGETRNAQHQSTHVGCSVLLTGKKWKRAELELLLRSLAASVGLERAYAGSRDEWTFRHINIKHFGEIAVQRSLGVDMSAFLPGLYWWTVFSDELAARHSLDIDELIKFSGHYECWSTESGGQLHAFRLFESPGGWNAEKDRISTFLEKHPNFFSMTRLQPHIDAVASMDELERKERPFWAGARPWV